MSLLLLLSHQLRLVLPLLLSFRLQLIHLMLSDHLRLLLQPLLSGQLQLLVAHPMRPQQQQQTHPMLLLSLRLRLLFSDHLRLLLRPLLSLRLRLLLSAHFRLPLRPLLSDQLHRMRLLVADCLRLLLALRQRLLPCWHRLRPLLSNRLLGAWANMAESS